VYTEVKSEVKSEYIRSKIETVSWANHSYVDDLIKLSEYIQRRPNGFAANMHFYQLNSPYAKASEVTSSLSQLE
jgi:hypothetical protein